MSNTKRNPDPERFAIVRHAAEKALPGMPSTARPAWWELIDRYAYPGEETDTLGFYREGFARKGEAVTEARERNQRGTKGAKRSIMTLR